MKNHLAMGNKLHLDKPKNNKNQIMV